MMNTLQQQEKSRMMSKRIRKTSDRFQPSPSNTIISTKKSRKQSNKKRSMVSQELNQRESNNMQDNNEYEDVQLDSFILLKEPTNTEYIRQTKEERELQLPLNPKVGLYPGPYDDEDSYFVENIVHRKKTRKNNKWLFKVREYGWDSKFDTWKTFHDLSYFTQRLVYERYTDITLDHINIPLEEERLVEEQMIETKRITDERNERLRGLGLPLHSWYTIKGEIDQKCKEIKRNLHMMTKIEKAIPECFARDVKDPIRMILNNLHQMLQESQFCDPSIITINNDEENTIRQQQQHTTRTAKKRKIHNENNNVDPSSSNIISKKKSRRLPSKVKSSCSDRLKEQTKRSSGSIPTKQSNKKYHSMLEKTDVEICDSAPTTTLNKDLEDLPHQMNNDDVVNDQEVFMLTLKTTKPVNLSDSHLLDDDENDKRMLQGYETQEELVDDDNHDEGIMLLVGYETQDDEL